VRILAFADIHRNAWALARIVKRKDEIDYFVCAGDLTHYNHGLDEMMRILRPLGEKLIIIPGNNEKPAEVEELAARYGFSYIDGRKLELEGYTFVGLGGSPITPFNTPYEWREEFAEGVLAKFKKERNVVLVSHAPPASTKLDQTWDGRHVGSKAVRAFIEEGDVVLVICGHVHEAAGVEEVIGKARCLNPGREGVELVL